MASEPAALNTQPSYHGGPVGEDSDPEETREWLDALQAVLEREGPERAHFLLERLVDKARRTGAHIPFTAFRIFSCLRLNYGRAKSVVRN